MKRIFLHGLDSSSQGHKARQLSAMGVLTPDFQGSLEQRMVQLEPYLHGDEPWILVGSSFGGLMAALWTLHNPQRVARLILLAPALHRAEFVFDRSVQVPTVLFHGTRDSVVPHELATQRARAAFENLTVHWVDDDHRLTATSQSLDWKELLLDE